MAQNDRSLYNRLRRLFSTQVVVRKVGKGKLRVVDTERLQSQGNKNLRNQNTRYSGVYASSGYRAEEWENHLSVRQRLYQDYEAMDSDSIIASVLDVYSEECTVRDDFGDILQIHTEDHDIKEILDNLFYDILNIEYNLFGWIRTMIKYGDTFLYLHVDPEVGIVNVTPLSSYEIIREEGYDENNPYAVRFRLEENANQFHHTISQTKKYFEYHEVAHFRLLTDPNFLPYGRSLIEPARKVWKQLILMEDAMMINRIMKAPERRVFKVDVGNVAPNEVDQYMKELISRVKKVPYVDESTGEYNLKFNLMNMLEDFYLPVRGGDSGTEIDTLSGMEWNGIDDIEYLRNRMLAGLKVPKSFINYLEDTEGKATMAQQDIRFARQVERVQNITVSELTKIAIIHLYSQGYSGEDLVNFELKLTPPSIVLRQEKISLWQEQTRLSTDMKDNSMMSEDWIYKHVWNLSEREMEEQKKLIIEDKKNKFRLEQIEREGNDPADTGEVLGTPHALATVDPENSGEEHTGLFGHPEPQQEEPKMGRPEEGGSDYGTQESNLTRDPLGKEELRSRKRRGSLIKHDYKNGPMGLEIKRISKMKRPIKLNEETKRDLLDEDNLLEL